MTHGFDLIASRGDGAGNIYLEAAAGVTTFLLAGRYFEKRSKLRAGDALRALAEVGAKDVTVVRDGRETTVPIGELQVGNASWSGPARRSRRTDWWCRGPPPSTSR